MVYHIQVQVFTFDMSGSMVHLDPRVARTSHQNNASFAGGFAAQKVWMLHPSPQIKRGFDMEESNGMRRQQCFFLTRNEMYPSYFPELDFGRPSP